MTWKHIRDTRGARDPLSSSGDLPLLLRVRDFLSTRWFFFHDTDDDTDKVRTPSGDLVSLGGGSEAAPLVSLLGPFPIDRTMTDLFNTAVELVALDAGSIVLRAWAIVTEAWGSASPGEFDIKLEIGPGTAAVGVVVAWSDGQLTIRGQGAAYALGEASPSPNSPPQTNVVMVAQAGQFLCAIAQNYGDPLIGGQADVYALVYTPSS